MKNKVMLGQGLAWAAWIAFIVSLFLPFESHTLPMEVSWCSSRPAYCGWQSAGFFAFSPLILVLNLFQSIPTAILYPNMLGAALYIVFTMALYTVIGLGQFLVVLAPIWPIKINKIPRRKLHLWIVSLSSVSVIAYGLFPDIRQGLDVLNGYYVWALSFFLLLGASILMREKMNEPTTQK